MALDGVSWVQSGSVQIAVGQAGRMLQKRRHHLLPPSGVAPLGSSVRPPIWLSGARLGRLELGAVSEHGMHDDGEAPRQRDPRLAHGGSPEPPSVQILIPTSCESWWYKP